MNDKLMKKDKKHTSQDVRPWRKNVKEPAHPARVKIEQNTAIKGIRSLFRSWKKQQTKKKTPV